MLGVVAGIVCRTFPTWTLVGGLGSRSGLFAFVGIVATIALVALLEPYLGRLRVFETPYAKLQFATPAAERQLELDIQRDLAFYEGLSSVTRTAKIVQLDCGYEAIENGGIDRFKKGDLYQAFAGALAVRSEIVDFLVRVVPISAVCLLLSLGVIRGFMRPITRTHHKFVFVSQEDETASPRVSGTAIGCMLKGRKISGVSCAE